MSEQTALRKLGRVRPCDGWSLYIAPRGDKSNQQVSRGKTQQNLFVQCSAERPLTRLNFTTASEIRIGWQATIQRMPNPALGQIK
jgi:hypothetical protein